MSEKLDINIPEVNVPDAKMPDIDLSALDGLSPEERKLAIEMLKEIADTGK